MSFDNPSDGERVSLQIGAVPVVMEYDAEVKTWKLVVVQDAAAATVTTIDSRFEREAITGNVLEGTRTETVLAAASDEEYLFFPQAAGSVIALDGSADGDMRVRVYEDPTISASGTAITLRNLDRRASDVTDALLFNGTTFSADGTLLADILVPGGTLPGVSGGGSLSGVPRIFAAGKRYRIRQTNLSGVAAIAAGFGIRFFSVSEL